MKTIEVELWLRVENNSKFVRGKYKARAEIEQFLLERYAMRKPFKDRGEYILTIPYQTEKELDDIVGDILSEASSIADRRYCFIEEETHVLADPERRLPRSE